MEYDKWLRESARLQDVLKDACERGDYHLEMDVREALQKLNDEYYGEE